MRFIGLGELLTIAPNLCFTIEAYEENHSPISSFHKSIAEVHFLTK